jgi:DeoR/GlpR family transcriptional regulator of sugar metabolism
MPDNHDDKLSIHVNIQISANALQAVVANAKRTVPQSPDGNYRVDTADFVGTMVSRFLDERDFDSFAMDVANYKSD